MVMVNKLPIKLPAYMFSDWVISNILPSETRSYVALDAALYAVLPKHL